MKRLSTHSITGVILCGGLGRRMGSVDKGFIHYKNTPLIQHAIQALTPQVDTLFINANRNIDDYRALGFPVVRDGTEEFLGPLSGILAAMKVAKTDYIIAVPCDSPCLSSQLRQRMMETLLIEQADIAVAHDGVRLQPVFCLIPCRLQDELEVYINQGGRKIDAWFAQYKMTSVDFSDQADSFVNFNYPEDIAQSENKLHSPIPLLGIAAFSGTGKTTLLQKLIPELLQQKIRVAVIKHAHHQFDIDIPGKDSYEIRKAGAQQVLISSCNLMALMEVQATELTDPKLADLIPRLDASKCDLILVEGFKHENMSKIELHRPQLNKPLLCLNDPTIIAIAHDDTLSDTVKIAQLDLNNTTQIADYIHTFISHWKA